MIYFINETLKNILWGFSNAPIFSQWYPERCKKL